MSCDSFACRTNRGVAKCAFKAAGCAAAARRSGGESAASSSACAASARTASACLGAEPSMSSPKRRCDHVPLRRRAGSVRNGCDAALRFRGAGAAVGAFGAASEQRMVAEAAAASSKAAIPVPGSAVVFFGEMKSVAAALAMRGATPADASAAVALVDGTAVRA
eukprot:3718062-Pleurochrysis_carterae.AAC.4